MPIQTSDLQRNAINQLLEEIYSATVSGTAELELPQIAKWSGIPLETLTDLGKQLVESKLAYDIEAEEFSQMLERYRKIDQLEDPGLRAWKLQALARKYKRPVTYLTEAYNKALINQAAVKPLTVAEFKALHDREINWLVPGWIPEATTLLLHADGGVGKTLFAYQLMESVLYGKPWNGYSVERGKVLLVQTDEPTIVTSERIDIRGIGDEAPLTILSDWQVEGMSRLETYIASARPSLVIIDSLTSINRNSVFSENDTEYARPILELANFANTYNCVILLIHHSNAEGSSRGTRAIYNSVSEVWGLSLADGGDRLLRVQKTRLGRPPGRYKFAFDDDDFSFRYLGEDNGEDSDAIANQEDRVRLWFSEDDQRGKPFTTVEVAEYVGITKHCARRSCYELWAKGLLRRTRPKGERAYLYYAGDLHPATSDPAIRRDPSPAIGVKPRAEAELSAMRSSDLQTAPIFTVATDDFGRSRDRMAVNPRFDGQPDAISTSDQSDAPSDRLAVIDNDDRVSDQKIVIQTCDESPDEEPISNQEEVLQVGDTVVALAIARWYRSGSDKLPWKEVPKSQRSAAEIPIQLLGEPLFQELLEPSKVLSLSKDGQRAKIRNQTTGRTSVFAVAELAVIGKAGGRTNG